MTCYRINQLYRVLRQAPPTNWLVFLKDSFLLHFDYTKMKIKCWEQTSLFFIWIGKVLFKNEGKKTRCEAARTCYGFEWGWNVLRLWKTFILLELFTTLFFLSVGRRLYVTSPVVLTGQVPNTLGVKVEHLHSDCRRPPAMSDTQCDWDPLTLFIEVSRKN